MSIKDELKKDEELLVKVFQLEKFLKKYKKPLLIATGAVVVLALAFSIYNYYQTRVLINSNNALTSVLENPNNKKALEEIKSNEKLYNLYLLKKGEYSKINLPELEEIKAYKLAMQKGDIASLTSYLNNPKYKILKNSVRVALIKKYLENNQRNKALMIANQIPVTSKYKEIATYLIHYGIVK
jgi:hypothetical protein